jgi:hypothetical protein
VPENIYKIELKATKYECKNLFLAFHAKFNKTDAQVAEKKLKFSKMFLKMSKLFSFSENFG